jgi:hypothetical protein
MRVILSFICIALVVGAASPPMLGASATYRAEVLADHPIAYYRLDERFGTVAHDSSGNGFDGVIGRHVVKGAPGLISDAPTSMEFEGADKSSDSEDIRVKGNQRFAVAKALTIEAWVLSYNVGPQGKNSGDVTLVAYGNDLDPDKLHCRYALELDGRSQIWHFPAVVNGRPLDQKIGGIRSFLTAITNYLGPTQRAAYEVYAASGTDGNPPVAKRLYYLAGTYDGETMRFYINGDLNNVLRVRGQIEGYALGNGLGIGGEFKDVNPVFHGRIGEVAIYDRTLSPERIKAHYLAGGASLAKPAPSKPQTL